MTQIAKEDVSVLSVLSVRNKSPRNPLRSLFSAVKKIAIIFRQWQFNRAGRLELIDVFGFQAAVHLDISERDLELHHAHVVHHLCGDFHTTEGFVVTDQ